MSYKYNARISSSPKVVGVHIHEHSNSNNNQRNSVKGAIKVKQRVNRSNSIRLQPDLDGFSDSSDSTNCSELSNTNNNISSYYSNRKNSANSYTGRSLSSSGSVQKRNSLAAKRISVNTDRPPIPIKNNNIMKKISIDSSNYDSSITASPDKKMLAISINDQASDRALRKIMDLEILNESLRSINESLECTIKEQSLKMEQLQLQIDHLKTASTLNSATTNNEALYDYFLNKDTSSDSEIKIIPRHPEETNKDNYNKLSSSIPKPKEIENILENNELNEEVDIQFKRICAKLDFLINDATKAIGSKPTEFEKEFTKVNKLLSDPNDIKIEKRLSSDPNNIKIERRHNITNNHESSSDNNSSKVIDSNITLVEDEDEEYEEEFEEEYEEEYEEGEEEGKEEEEEKEEKDLSFCSNNNNVNVNKEETNNSRNDILKINEVSKEKPVIFQSYGEIQSKYKKIFNIINKLNSISKDVINETKKLEESQNIVNNNENESQNEKDEKSKSSSNSSSNKGLAMLLNPFLSYSNNNNNNINNDNDNDKNVNSESSTNKIKDLALSMNNTLGNLMDILNEEKQKELKQSEEQSKKVSNSNVRCPVVIKSVLPEKPNKNSFNRRNSSVTSPKYNRTPSVERSNNSDVLNNESMMKINAILNSSGNSVINSTGYPSILTSIPFKKDNKLFHRTKTWDPQYLNHYRIPSSLRNVQSPSLGPSVVIATSNTSTNNNNNNNNNNNSSKNSNNSTSKNNSTSTNNDNNTSTNNKNSTLTNNNNDTIIHNKNNTSLSSSSSSSTSTTPTLSQSPVIIKSNINSEEKKIQAYIQGLERKKTHLPSFYL